MPRRTELLVQVSPDRQAFNLATAELFARVATEAVEARGTARIAISGGHTPEAIFQLLADPAHALHNMVPWQRIQLFWVDERCVPPDHPESNFGMTKHALLDAVPLAAEHIHRMEGELLPEEGASRYEAAIRDAFKLEGAQTPTFDLILLGMGDDGHTASLFPHTEGLNEMARICIANHVPQKDTWRLTLTWPVITQGREVVMLVEGESKADILKTVYQGSYDPETWPAQLIRPASGRMTLMLDAAAASKLSLPDASGSGGSASADGVSILVLT